MILVTGRTIAVVLEADQVQPFNFTFDHRARSFRWSRHEHHRMLANFRRRPTAFTSRHSMTYRWVRA